ncbi:hypothetical protein [Haloferax prahovense]|uniref:hypothetical protein n=1 Tax=Haloferax prahovense TaxID=381852 RepID=UPI000ACC3019|nr:hypothetical protein [Haloferax prahovense]
MADILEQAESDLLADDNPLPLEHHLRVLDVAVSAPVRFALLHCLYTADNGLSRTELADSTGLDGDELDNQLHLLMDVNLITG